ncbi:transposase [Coraliomargarita algicola]|uniref:Transposase n=1 Tax=Coraliomargarita algicola TaxID=3092156 RepID=A0ABZ0RMN3_9BACT|nr:transposase [Coraliomargarita sp. J2-16]WPJ97485.1 transposase [Coraliomargarita sp. J2-16]
MNRRRLIIPESTTAYHLICRTACQAYLFGDQEKEVFVRLLLQQARFAGIEILSYCIMSNHVHLLVRISPIESLPDRELLHRYRSYYGAEKVPQSTYSVEELQTLLRIGGPDAEVARRRVLARMGDLSAFMRELKQRFTIWYNHKHDNQGTIWASRYKSLIVENASESLAKVAAYIDLNPIRAEMVDDPKDYRWCGYAAAMAGRKAQKDAIIKLFSEEDTFSQAIANYRLILFGKGYISKGSATKDQGSISPAALEKVIADKGHVSTHELLRMRVRYFADGTAIGSKVFVEDIVHRNRAAFGLKRKKTSTALPPQIWGDLHVLRDLKRDVYTQPRTE